MRFLIFIICFTSIVFSSMASEKYFDFSLPSLMLVPNKEIPITFNYSLKGISEKDFIVVPRSENAVLEIYNKTTGTWIKQGDVRSRYPVLEQEMMIRVRSFGGTKANICIDIQCLKNGFIYQTPCRTYWNRDYFKKYIDLINDKILRWIKEKTEN